MSLASTVETLTCFSCEAKLDPNALETLCHECGMPLRVDLDLPVGNPADLIHTDDFSMWRYAGVLPVQRSDAVSLVEGFTPLIEVGETTWIKDETRNPTGSFKARGLSMAVSAAVLLGAERLVAPSAGNAASALAAYGAAASVPVLVAMPEDTPKPFIDECRHFGADVNLVPGTISDAGRWLAANRGQRDFDVSTMKEPYRVEGKKTMGIELAEQLGWKLPDVIIYPTGGGTGLVGMWKAFDELEALGCIGAERPRMVAVQSTGCAPVIRAFEAGDTSVTPWEGAKTVADGLRVPMMVGDQEILRALRESNGTAIAVPDEESMAFVKHLGTDEGIYGAPEDGAVLAAIPLLLERGDLDKDETVVGFLTGSGYKYRSGMNRFFAAQAG